MRNYSEVTAPIRGIGPENKIWHDHMDDWFRTQKKLCEAWNTNQGRVYGRLKRKLSVEDTLTLPPNHTPTAIACIDPLGRHFSSKNEMYAAWGTNKDEFWHRVNIKKMSPEQALMYEQPKYMDYEGKVFKSKKAMCEAHSTTTARYDYRVKHGATLEYALEPKSKNEIDVIENNNVTKKEVSELKKLCEQHGMNYSTCLQRLFKGYTLDQALTMPPQKHGTYERTKPRNDTTYKCCYDHLGNFFKSQRQMCEHWKVDPNTYIYRCKRGYSVEQALTGSKPIKDGKSNIDKNAEKKNGVYTDPNGNTFTTRAKMCHKWGVSVSYYLIKLDNGCTMLEALTPNPENPERKYRDHTGQCFVSKTEMCEHWGITLSTYTNRLRKGYSQERALTEKDTRFCECEDHLGNKYKTKSEMCNAYGIKISTYNMRIKYGMTVEEALTHKRNAHRAAKLAA